MAATIGSTMTREHEAREQVGARGHGAGEGAERPGVLAIHSSAGLAAGTRTRMPQRP